MAIPYTEAIDILKNIAIRKSQSSVHNGESIPISASVGRICRASYQSLVSTPAFDTSAMDGFAVNSVDTLEASETQPIMFCVQGIIAAGDVPKKSYGTQKSLIYPCVEIMTGAQFPDPTGKNEFDACIRIEDTTAVIGPDPAARYIQITKPAQRNQNRKFAGNDFRKEDVIISAGTTIKPHHIMAFPSLGITEVDVFRKLHVGILSTGSELISHEALRDGSKPQIRDSNGPYIEAVLTGLGVEVTKLGIVEDDAEAFETILAKRLVGNHYDMIITTGAVSMGKFDFVGNGIADMGATVRFHRVGIRPGHPVLFATLPAHKLKGGSRAGSITPPPVDPEAENGSEIAFFGLPGSPLASAVCLRFLVIPYLRALHSLPTLETPTIAILNSGIDHKLSRSSAVAFPKPSHLQVFWHGKLDVRNKEVSISRDQGSNKIRPLLQADCWVGVPAGMGGVRHGDVVEVFEMYPQSLGL